MVFGQPDCAHRESRPLRASTALLLFLAALGSGCGLTSATAPASTTASAPVPVSVTVSPPSGSVLLGNTMTLSAVVANTANTAVTWSVAGVPSGNSPVGTISAGIFTAPQLLPTPAVVAVTATSVADATKSATATVTIASDIGISVLPESSSAELGSQQAFQATITSAGKPSAAVSWSLSGAGCIANACGAISPSGVFTAPQVLPSPAIVLVTATSGADPSKAETVAVSVTSRFTLAISGPSSATVSSTTNFAALLTPIPGSNPSSSIRWSVSGAGCSGAACGSIAALGSGATASYTTPATAPSPSQVSITATPIADPSKAQAIQVTITPLPVTALTLSPTTATVALGATANFTGTVTGNSNASVIWDVNGVIGGNATLGTIVASPSNSGAATYTAPQTMPGTNPVSVRASSNADPSATATAEVTLAAPQVSLAPAAASLIAGQRQTFTAQVSNATATNVTWQVNGIPGGGSGGSSGLGQICVVNSNPCQTVSSAAAGSVDYIAPTAVPSTNPVTLTAVSQADTAQSASSTITILPHVVVSVLPPSVTLAPGASQLFGATVAGSANQQVTWTVSGTACSGANAPCGTVDATGLYQAPASAPAPNNLTVMATSSADTTRTAFAAVTITTTPTITSLLPSSATAGAAGGFTLQVEGANFTPSSPGPGSTILISGSARNTVCATALACTTTLASSDLQIAESLSVVVQNPSGMASNSVAFVILPANGAPTDIPVTTGAPSATGQDIVVVDLSTDGAAAPAADVSLNVAAIGIFVPATGSCSLGGGPVELTPPASGTATEDLCAFSTSGLDPSLLYTLSGPSPGDIAIVGAEPLGLGIIHLTLEVPASAKAGARSLLIENANLDVTAGSGAIDVQ